MPTDHNARTLYSIGDCPVCSDSGAMILLIDVGTKRSVFFCPLCGVAWSEPPPALQLDEISALENLAPNGVTLPTATEARATGLPLTEVAFDEWYPLLKDFLERH